MEIIQKNFNLYLCNLFLTVAGLLFSICFTVLQCPSSVLRLKSKNIKLVLGLHEKCALKQAKQNKQKFYYAS